MHACLQTVTLHIMFVQPIGSDITAYASSLEQAQLVGDSLISESDPEESQKIEGRLSALAEQFSRLEAASQSRLEAMGDAIGKAGRYEGRCDGFDGWLKAAEERLAAWEPDPVVSQPLTRQLEAIKVR